MGPSEATRYEDYVARQLRIRYSELEGSMRTVVEPCSAKDRLIAERVYGYLQRARSFLEGDVASNIEASAYLNLADRYIVWLYPQDCLHPETARVLARLEHFKPIGWSRFSSELVRCDSEKKSSEPDLDKRKAALDQAIAAVNEAVVEERISTYLQIRCLRHLMYAGIALLIALCLMAPLAIRAKGITEMPDLSPWIPTFVVDSFGVAIVVELMGGLGGFLSALMEARRMKMTVDIYQERLLLLTIRPLVGGLVSLILFYLLSWGVVPAISPGNFGSYLLVAFAAGFSEKYFLRLLPLDPNQTKLQEGPAPRDTVNETSSHGVATE